MARKAKKKVAPRKKNPQDATMRNVRAATKRLGVIESMCHYLFSEISEHSARLDKLERGR